MHIPAAKANELFDLIDKFAGYGFNKSHAAGYALIAYQTAWLKAHHRAEFYAASMSFDLAQTDKLALFVEDMRRGGVECLPPDINASHAAFHGRGRQPSATRSGALKGVGEKAMEALVAERERGRAVQQPRGFRRAHRSHGCSTAASSKASPAAGAFDEHQARPRRRYSPRPRRSSPMPRARTTSGPAARRACSAAGSVRGRADPPAARRPLDAGPAHGRRARRLRLLFLGPPGRCAAPLARRAQGQAASPSWPTSASGRGRARRARPWRRWSRKRPLAHLGPGPPLHDGDLSRPLGPVRCDGVRRRALRSARSGGEGRRLRAADGRARPARRATMRRA